MNQTQDPFANSADSYQHTPIRDLPQSQTIMILGIISGITGLMCMGPISLVLGIISLVMAKKEQAMYNENPDEFTKSSFENMKLGKIFGIIGTILGSLGVLFLIAYFIFFIALMGAAGMSSASSYY